MDSILWQRHVAGLMEVLVHEFTHVMTVYSGGPMSEKEDREDAEPEDYAEFPEETVAFIEMIKFMYYILRKPVSVIEKELREIVGDMNQDEIEEWMNTALASVITASYPKHPDTIVVTPNEYYPEGLTEHDVWNYYDNVKEEILNELKGHDVMLVLNADGAVYKRHGADPNEFIQVNSVEDFEELNNGRVIEFHKVIGNETDYGFVDVDPKEGVSFVEVLTTVGELRDWLEGLAGIKNVEVAYSGGRGFHLYPKFVNEKSVSDVKKELKQAIGNFIEETGDDSLTQSIASEGQIRLDTSTLKSTGSLRVPYSLNASTGLRCIPITGSLSDFNKNEAMIPSTMVFSPTRTAFKLPETEAGFIEALHQLAM